MIQRIQSLYLLGAGCIGLYNVIMGLMIDEFDTYQLTVLTIDILITLLTFFIIFKFNNRQLQIKLTRLLLLLIIAPIVIGLSMIAWIMYIDVPMNIGGQPDTISFIPLLLPILQITLVFLALRAIKKDEEKVRSVDRLR